MKPLRTHLVMAARPNFMKVAPLFHELARVDGIEPRLIHTGQHYDIQMSQVFLDELGIPRPDVDLGVGSGTHAEQTAAVLVAYERLLAAERPGLVVVVGDVNSTMACALAARKLDLPVAHLEAGLRSRDRTMPEETNRVVTDAISDVLWTPSEDADANLQAEGHPPGRITRVGNIMIDTYEMMRKRIQAAGRGAAPALEPRGYGIATLHRPHNVDDPTRLAAIVGALEEAARVLPLVFPVHPRTKKRLADAGLWSRLATSSSIHILDPLPYVAFMGLVSNARFVLTDSGGVQEETTYLGIPCLTLRENTERPITTTVGTNRLVTLPGLPAALATAMDGAWPRGRVPDLWDGKTATRVRADIERRFLA